MTLLMLLGGILVFGGTSYLFWLLGRENGISPKWRDAGAMESIWVAIILGGWAAGAALAVKALLLLIG